MSGKYKDTLALKKLHGIVELLPLSKADRIHIYNTCYSMDEISKRHNGYFAYYLLATKYDVIKKTLGLDSQCLSRFCEIRAAMPLDEIKKMHETYYWGKGM